MDSHFITPMITEKVINDDEHWILVEPLSYYSKRLDRVITVPAGFETDLASVPRIPVVYLAVGGVANEPAVIHDFLYRHSGFSRKDADAVFEEAMGVNGVSWWRRKAMWLGLRAFGWTCYNKEES